MRHLKAGRRLNRNASHRAALYRNLARGLFEHGRIITTLAKAKAVRPFVEKLITLAKKGTLHPPRRETQTRRPCEPPGLSRRCSDGGDKPHRSPRLSYCSPLR